MECVYYDPKLTFISNSPLVFMKESSSKKSYSTNCAALQIVKSQFQCIFEHFSIFLSQMSKSQLIFIYAQFFIFSDQKNNKNTIHDRNFALITNMTTTIGRE